MGSSSRFLFVPTDSGVAGCAGDGWSGVATVAEVLATGVGGCPFTDGLRLGLGLGVGFVARGDFGVCGESAARPGVGGFAGVDAEAGGVDDDAVASETRGFFFGRVTGVACADWVRGLGWVN